MWAFYEEIRDTMDKLSFDFTKTEYLRISEEAMLTDLQKKVFEDKIKRLTITEMAQKHNVSPETVSRTIKQMKDRILKVL